MSNSISADPNATPGATVGSEDSTLDESLRPRELLPEETRAIGYVAADTRTWLQKFWSRLYPQAHVPIPEDLEGFAPSYMVTGVVTHLDWKDRLRVLVSGNLRVEIQTKTDVIVTKMVSQSAVSVLPPGRHTP